jgi:PAS domain S-box-containing protein
VGSNTELEGDGKDDPRSQGPSASSKTEIKLWILITISALAFIALYTTSTYNYLLFHTLVELFSIAVAFAIFIMAWNVRRMINGYFLVLSIGFLFFGFVDLIHTLAYSGMGVFGNISSDPPTQLWIVARGLQAATFIIAPLVISKKGLNPYIIFTGFFAVTSALLLSVWSGIFPSAFVTGSGLTAFKVVSEYVIALGLVLGAYLLYRRRDELDRSVAIMMIASIGLAVGAELSFTNYLNVYGTFNMLGHLLKLAEFIVIYGAVIKITIENPFRTLFKEVGDSEKRYRTIVDTANSLIVGLDRRGNVTLFNPSSEILTGLSATEVVGTSFITQMVPAAKKQEAEAIISKMSTGETSEWQMPIKTKNGERMIWWHNATIPGKEGDHYLIIGLDITDQQRMTQRLEDLNQTMAMVHKIVLHDVKNELAVILKTMAFYKRNNDPEILDLVSQAANRSMNLLEKMRDVEQLAMVGGSNKPIQVAEVVERVFDEHKASKVEFERMGNVQIIGDETFKIAIDNLVNNALMHANPSKIAIEISDKGENCEITVKDDGKGIPNDVKTRIFDEGFKYGKTGNMGMGLHIVLKVIQRHHGNIAIMDNDPKGTMFIITIPKNQPQG